MTDDDHAPAPTAAGRAMLGAEAQRDALGETLRRLVRAVEGVGFNPAREPGLALAEARLLVAEWERDTARSPRGDLPEGYQRLLGAVFGDGPFVPEHVLVTQARATIAQAAADIVVLVELANHEDDCPVWTETDESGPDGHECACRYGPIAERYPYTEEGVIEPTLTLVPMPDGS